jgi:diguanylate cyclase (GGDEF)-like protein/PAS domain S-box-containing protein
LWLSFEVVVIPPGLESTCVLHDESRQILGCNAAFHERFGGGPDLDVTTLSDDPPALREAITAAARGEHRTIVQTLRYRDGTLVPARVTLTRLDGAQPTILLIARDLVTRSEGTEGLRRHVERTMRQEAALLALLGDAETDRDVRLRHILRADAQTLAVSRASYWSMSPDASTIRCEALYLLDDDAYESGIELSAAAYPRYFAALERGRLIAATDAHTHADTSEFSSGYLGPLGIGAMLDVPVYVRGALVGVVCHEHVGGERQWSVDEQQFAMSIGQMASLAILSHERANAEAALRESEARFRAIAEASPVPMLLVTRPEGRCLFGNAAASELSGVPIEQMVGQRAPDFYANPADRDLVLADLAAHGHVTGRELLVKRADGSTYWVLLSIRPLMLGEQPAMVVGFVDVTEQKRLEERLRHTALHDPLTGLPNRALFFDLVRREMARAARDPSYRFAVLYVDLDGFKRVNDELGHDVGDELLVDVANRLRAGLRPMDIAARLGGDEFTVLVADLSDFGEATRVAERLEAILSEPHDLHGHQVTTTASIGVAPSRRSHASPDDLLREADTAMYRAKQAGRARLEISGPSSRA